MHPRYRYLRQISRLSPYICSEYRLRQSGEAINLLASNLIPLCHSHDNRIGDLKGGVHSQWYSTVSQVPNEPCTREPNEILSLIESAFDEIQGPNHCWFNVVEGNTDFFEKGGIFLVLAGQFIGNPLIVSMLEILKSIQHRYPQLRVMGFHSGSSIHSAAVKTQVVQLIMAEYITFPILLSDKNYLGMKNGACYILFKDFRNPILYHEGNLDLEMLNKAVQELHEQSTGNVENATSILHILKGSWSKQAKVIKEPYSCSLLQNFLLYFPACISADEGGNRLFLSDSNHHRVIICDGSGMILDCIGSCPGFEDGEFESAKLVRPAATYYHDAEDCLYIVDSENHAIRKADMQRRVVETLYATLRINKKNNSVWSWIANKLGFGWKFGAKSEEFKSQSLVSPWHLLKSEDNSFLIISRSFEAMWVMDLASGEIKESIKGFQKIWDTCGQLIRDKASLLKQMPGAWLQQHTDTHRSPKQLQHMNLTSSFTTFHNHIMMCDTVAQRVLKLCRESGASSNFQLSNFEMLGMPYWSSFPLERVYSVAGSRIDHIQCFSLLPGRVDIHLNVDIPNDIELVEPLQEGCIWRQARGTATEVVEAEKIVGSSEKVSLAQQWYDEMDNLAFSAPETEISVENYGGTLELNYQGRGVHIDSAVNTSPGTSEVIIRAAMYLRLRRHPDFEENDQEKCAARMAEILNPGRSGGQDLDPCIQLLLESSSNLRDFIFVRPLHVRVKLDSPEHPKVGNTRDVILTNSAVKVNVSL